MPHDPTDTPRRRPWADRLRHTLPLLAVILLAALATSAMWTQRRSAVVPVELASAPAEPAGRPDSSLPRSIDHSVAEQRSLPDEPDMTGASIGAYGH